jgi:hypothetical protein
MDAHYSQARTSICMFMEIVRWTIGCNDASVCHAKGHELVFCSNSGMNIGTLNPQNEYNNRKLRIVLGKNQFCMYPLWIKCLP